MRKTVNALINPKVSFKKTIKIFLEIVLVYNDANKTIFKMSNKRYN